jgi:hypothetical protein
MCHIWSWFFELSVFSNKGQLSSEYVAIYRNRSPNLVLLGCNIYLSFRSCDSCRRLPEPKHHSLGCNMSWEFLGVFTTFDAACEPLGKLRVFCLAHGARPTLFLIFMLFFVFLCCSMYCLFCVVLCIVCVCICVLYYCHRVATQLQLTYITSYHIYHIICHITYIISYHITT